MKKFLITLIVTAGLMYLIHRLAFGPSITLRSAVDSMFVLGIFLFFIGLLVLTGASRVFVTLKYSIRSVFGRQHAKYANLYDYSEAHRRDRSSYSSWIFILGTVYLIVSIFLSYQVLM